MTEYRHVDVAVMERLLRASADRCCYCQRRDGYTLDNPKIEVTPKGVTPTLVAHANCDEPVQAWRRGRM